MSSIASGRVSANSAVSSSGVSATPSRARAIAPADEVGAQRPRRLRAAAARARDEAPVARLDDVEHALRHPLRVDVARVDAEALGEREALPRRAACAPGGARETDARARCGRRWRSARRGRSRRRGRARGHQSARFGGICTPTSGMSRRHSATSRRMSSIVTGVAQAGRSWHAAPRPRSRCATARAPPRRRSAPAPARSSWRAGRSSAGSPPAGGRARRARRRARRAPPCAPSSRLADPDEDPARERDAQLAGRADRRQAALGVLRRRALVGDEIGVDGLEHEPLRRRHLAQPREVGRADSTPRFVCGSSPRSSACSQAQTT